MIAPQIPPPPLLLAIAQSNPVGAVDEARRNIPSVAVTTFPTVVGDVQYVRRPVVPPESDPPEIPRDDVEIQDSPVGEVDEAMSSCPAVPVASEVRPLVPLNIAN